MFKLLDTLIGYLKGKPYWAKIEPALTLFSLYLMTLVLAYQYIEWQYHFSPALGLYLRSYLVKQISLVYIGIGFLALVFGATRVGADEGRRSALRRLTR